MKVQAVLFDMDGVLIDATEWHYEALNQALAFFGYTISRYEHLTTYNGLPTRKKLEMLTVEKGLPQGLHGLINRLKQKFTAQQILRRCTPVFAKEYLVSRLRQDGLLLGVCSNAVRSSVTAMLDNSGLLEHFDVILSNEDVTNSKPDPEIYTTAMRRLAIDPAATVIVEDAPYGIQAARASGAEVLEVASYSEVDYERVRTFIEAVEAETPLSARTPPPFTLHRDAADRHAAGREGEPLPAGGLHLSQAAR
jgi:HAD superfamily hydrolase (TIGR01509 family)